MDKFKKGDRAVFNCDYGSYRVGDEVVITDVRPNYTYYRGVRDGQDGSCYHWRLDKVVDTPMLPLTGGREPATGEQYLDRAAEWLSENLAEHVDMSVTDALIVAQFLEYVDRKSA